MTTFFTDESLQYTQIRVGILFKDGSHWWGDYEISASANVGSLDFCRVFEKQPDLLSSREAAKSVFLFTDGLANQGVTTTPGIINAAKGASEAIMGKNPCTVHCFGFGADHDHDMLAKLAEACGGDYIFIENEGAIGNAFAQALGGLLSVVGQNITLDIDCSFPIELLNADGRITSSANGKTQVAVGDMYAEAERDIVVVCGPLEA